MKVIKNNPYAGLFLYVWRNLAVGRRSKLLMIYSIFIASVGLGSVTPFVYKWLIDEIQAGKDALFSVCIYAGACILIKVFSWALYYPIYLTQRNLAFNMCAEYLLALQQRVMQFSLEWHKLHHTASLVNRIKKSFDAIRNFLSDDFIYLRTFFRFFFATIAILYFSPLFGCVAIILGGITIYQTARFDRKILDSLDEVNEKDHQITSSISDNFTHYKTVLSLNLQSLIHTHIKRKLELEKKPFILSSRLELHKWIVVESLVTIIYITIAIGYVYQHYEPGNIFLIGGLVAILAYCTQFTEAFQDLAWIYAAITKTYSEFRAADIIRQPTEAQPREKKEKDKPALTWKTILISGLSFRYSDAKAAAPNNGALNHIDFEVANRHKIALIGECGCGKSTLLHILKGLFAEVQMNISVDGRPASVSFLSSQTFLLPQETELFNETVRYNLCLGSNFSSVQLREACEISGFNEVLAKMGGNLDTLVTQRGTNLSGGECQMLSIARMILHARNSSLLLLDEPTSNINPQKEISILARLFDIFREKAIVMTVHKYDLLPYFDAIYILRNGLVVWKGSYTEYKTHYRQTRQP